LACCTSEAFRKQLNSNSNSKQTVHRHSAAVSTLSQQYAIAKDRLKGFKLRLLEIFSSSANDWSLNGGEHVAMVRLQLASLENDCRLKHVTRGYVLLAMTNHEDCLEWLSEDTRN